MSWKKEIDNKERFEFGENWKNFLKNLDKTQIENAKKEL